MELVALLIMNDCKQIADNCVKAMYIIVFLCSIDSKKFEAWLEEVCKALPPKSCLVMDNASYHSKLVSPFCLSSSSSLL